MALYVFSQVVVMMGLGFDLWGRLLRDKAHLLVMWILSNLCYIISYVLLFSPLAAIGSAICLARTVLYLVYDQKNKPYRYYLWTIILLFVCYVPALVYFWQSWLDLCMAVSILSLLILMSLDNMLVIRVGLIFNSVLWLVYNIPLRGYMNMVCECISILITAIALWRYHLRPAPEKTI